MGHTKYHSLAGPQERLGWYRNQHTPSRERGRPALLEQGKTAKMLMSFTSYTRGGLLGYFLLESPGMARN